MVSVLELYVMVIGSLASYMVWGFTTMHFVTCVCIGLILGAAREVEK